MLTSLSGRSLEQTLCLTCFQYLLITALGKELITEAYSSGVCSHRWERGLGAQVG
jgi:hypothetical protein